MFDIQLILKTHTFSGSQAAIYKTSSSFAASCLRKSPTWSSIPLQRFKLALII